MRYDDERNGPVQLTRDEWDARRRKLDELGGPIDVRTWAQVSEEEKQLLRQPIAHGDDILG